MPAQPLTPAQLEDAARLKAALKRWQIARKEKGEAAAQETIAALLGFSTQSAVSQYVNGKIPLNVSAIAKFAELFGCQPEDISPDLAKEMKRIAAAVGSSLREPAREYVADDELAQAANDPFVAIPLKKIKIRAGVAGFSLDQTRDGNKGAIYISKDWVAKRGFIVEKLFATRVGGLSMWPRVDEGDIVLINTAETDRRNGHVYGFNHDGQFVLKRLERRLNRWWLNSDNPDKKQYPPIPAEEGTFMIGRAVLLQAEEI